MHKKSWSKKPQEWLRRYWLAELAALLCAYAGYFMTLFLVHHPIAAAFGASIGETTGYYIVILSKELLYCRRQDKSGIKALARTAVHVLTEFGPAEALDSLVLRPLFIGICAHYFGALAGVLTGKLVSDVTFYVPVIISYELRRKFYAQSAKKKKIHGK